MTGRLQFVYILANSVIALAGLAIPAMLAVLLLSRSNLFSNPATRIQIWLCGTFILVCGLGHLVENVGAFVWPNDWLFTAWNLLTAAVAVATAISLGWTVKYWLHARTRADLVTENLVIRQTKATLRTLLAETKTALQQARYKEAMRPAHVLRSSMLQEHQRKVEKSIEELERI